MNAEDLANIELIRPHLTGTLANPSNDDVISYALRVTADKLKDQPQPRHPRNKW